MLEECLLGELGKREVAANGTVFSIDPPESLRVLYIAFSTKFSRFSDYASGMSEMECNDSVKIDQVGDWRFCLTA